MSEPSPPLQCPKCRGSMTAYERNGVVVDECTSCRGIFLDRGELERLAAAEADYYRPGQPAPGAPPPGFQPSPGAPPPGFQPSPGAPPAGYGMPGYAPDPYGRRRYDDGYHHDGHHYDHHYDDHHGGHHGRRHSFLSRLLD